MTIQRRLQRAKNALFSKPYIWYFLAVFFGYLAINIIINKGYITLEILSAYRISFIIPFLVFFIVVAFLVALNVNLFLIKYKELRQVKTASGFTALGMFGGLLGGACPGCFVGLFPAFVGLFGISATLGNLPFFGLEIQLFSIGLLIISAFLLTRDTVCKADLAL